MGFLNKANKKNILLWVETVNQKFLNEVFDLGLTKSCAC